ncbi:uncharacterized protein LOC120712637 isoform X3 [Panicum virgatum]|uniref:Uncharacterized protein n=1 Tax=Panicum virgatum TaxID=38727 RepID=A0A8T0RF27_PANVG|nr:uncharacterized protein LOC120712637 isoform X3 [Panicum virgatum]KAG2584511.1 hypothetical protein PVAP13_6KG309500 [Panicum virgatum]
MNEVGVAACRCSIRHLYDVITAFDDVKRTLVEAIGFGGLLEFPAVRQINRQFSVWLMSKVLYLDSMDLGVWNMEPKFFPRIRCFSADRIRSMILADTLFPGDSYRLPEFGKSQLRKADGVPYVWARMRSEQFKLASAWEAAICVSRTLLVPMELLKVIPSVGEKIGRPLLLPAVRNALDSALSSQGAILASGPQIALLLHFNNKNGRSRLYGG